MKKPIAILLILVLLSVSLFAATESATINVSSEILPFATFGVSSEGVTSHYTKSIALFQQAIAENIVVDVVMTKLTGEPQIGFLSGINNTSTPIDIAITISDLVSGDNSVALFVYPTNAVIPAAANNSFGLLLNTRVKITAQNKGRALLAPAGDYEATITFALTT